MATALIAWFSAPAPTTWTSTPPACRTAPAIAPATEFGLDLVETLSVSIGAPRWAWRELSAYRCVIRRQHGAFLPLPRADLSFSRSCARRVTPPRQLIPPAEGRNRRYEHAEEATVSRRGRWARRDQRARQSAPARRRRG